MSVRRQQTDYVGRLGRVRPYRPSTHEERRSELDARNAANLARWYRDNRRAL